jgi:hypothetical protein
MVTSDLVCSAIYRSKLFRNFRRVRNMENSKMLTDRRMTSVEHKKKTDVRLSNEHVISDLHRPHPAPYAPKWILPY